MTDSDSVDLNEPHRVIAYTEAVASSNAPPYVSPRGTRKRRRLKPVATVGSFLAWLCVNVEDTKLCHSLEGLLQSASVSELPEPEVGTSCFGIGRVVWRWQPIATLEETLNPVLDILRQFGNRCAATVGYVEYELEDASYFSALVPWDIADDRVFDPQVAMEMVKDRGMQKHTNRNI